LVAWRAPGGFRATTAVDKVTVQRSTEENNTPLVDLGQKGARIGGFHYPLSGAVDEQGIAAIRRILESCSDPCLFMTSHFMYGTETKILTLSSKKPLSIIYKEIGCMLIKLD